MSLTTGSRLGGYEILSTLGVGGMGEVYRARDTKLNRDVALKVLRAGVADDPERLARFRREAHVLASLNHPNIAHIYGFEDSGEVHGLVMELVEGPTLADRIAQGPLPWSEVTPIALQIAEALETAHDQGIIHRDLKPANIKVRPDGAVKVLDFGLAKALETAPASDVSAMNSPTLTAATQHGIILGTAAYMSPEQAKGRPADKRSDVWAFGCVLYEMLTARRAFDGDDVSEVLASVIKSEPNLGALPDDVPPEIRSLIARCLTKERKARVPEIATVRFLIDNANRSVTEPAPSSAAVRRPSWTLVAAVSAAAVIAATATAALTLRPRSESTTPPVARFDIVWPADQGQPRGVTISPDGQTIVYSANRQLYMRTLQDPQARPIPGTATEVNGPQFSPDGRWVGYFSTIDSALKKVGLAGGAPVTICKVENARGFTWTPDNHLLVASDGIVRVSADGGSPETIIPAAAGETLQGPQFLDGDHIVFAVATAPGADRWDRAKIVVQSLRSGERRVLVEGGSDARLRVPGYLLYGLGSSMLAVAFDPNRRAVIGSPVVLVNNVGRALPIGMSGFDVAGNGTLVHLIGSGEAAPLVRLALVDRSGARTLLPVAEGRYSQPRVSPNGSAIALVHQDDQGQSAIWIHDRSGKSSMRRLTFDTATAPLWTRDGRRVIFGARKDASWALYWQEADGSGAEERLLDTSPDDPNYPNSVSADDTFLAFFTGRNRGDVWMMPFDRSRAPEALISLPTSAQDHAIFSPDGRWIAYRSNEAGRSEIYVQPFPTTGAKFQVTTTGGHSPLWSPDGKQIFYVDISGIGARVMSVDVQLQPGFTASTPVALPIEASLSATLRPFDITPDGKQFVVLVPADSRQEQTPNQQMRVTLNGVADLIQRLRAGK
jgi:serine/threonine-protein kinase